MTGRLPRHEAGGLTRRAAVALIAAAGLAARNAVSAPLPKPRRAVPTRGFALPGWLDAQTGEPPAPAVLDKLRALGFETIRLPFTALPLAGTEAGASREALGRIEAAVKLCLGAGFTAILDLHPGAPLAPVFSADAQAAADTVARAWSNLAPLLAGFDESRLYAELLNEPPLADAAWRGLRDRLAGIVRARCPRHGLVWGPARFQGIWQIADIPPLADPNAVAAVHYYWPMGFTHQCENWDDSPIGRLSHLPFPARRDDPAVTALAEKLRAEDDHAALAALEEEFRSPWRTGRIEEEFASLAAWSRQHDYPVMLGEFGALNFCADPASRANWVGAVRRAAEANGIGWTYWELDRGFGFIENRESLSGFEPKMLAALLGSRGAAA